jgi:hypothetical protein
MKKRSGPEEVDPVVRGNVRYDALHWGKTRGLGQNGGHVVATNLSDGRELWVTRLYEIKYDPNMEADKQDVFLISLVVDESGSRLIAQDERARRWAVDLFTRKVTAL